MEGEGHEEGTGGDAKRARLEDAAERDAAEEDAAEGDPEEEGKGEDAEAEAALEALQDDAFVITLGGMPLPAPSAPAQPGEATGTESATGEAATTAKKEAPAGPALRFSGSTLKPNLLALRTTAEQEEALRTMGVTPQNYALKMNPQGFVPGRRPNAFEIQMETLDHPKWTEPGSIQSDFFNYGLQEPTWREYAARQVALRLFRLQKAKEAAVKEDEEATAE